MPMFAINKLTGERVKAERTLDISKYPNDAFICPNPHCKKILRLKGNDLADSRIKKIEKKEEKKEKKMKKVPHWFHLEAEDDSIKYSEDSEVEIVSIQAIQNFLQISNRYLEIWMTKNDNNKETTLLLNVLYEMNENKYALEIRSTPINIEEYERREKAYPLYDLTPVWILHEKVSYGIENQNMEGSFGKGGNTRLLSSQFERRLARRQKYILYYHFVPDEITKEINFDNPKINISVVKYKKAKKGRWKYDIEEEYDIINKQQFDYILTKIQYEKEKYEELRKSNEFNEFIHYKFDEDLDQWIPDSRAVFCNKTNTPAFFPMNITVPQPYLIPSEMKEMLEKEKEENIKKGMNSIIAEINRQKKWNEYNKVDIYRVSD